MSTENRKLARRQFMQQTGSAAAWGTLAAAGFAARPAIAAETSAKWDKEVDVLVIGFGATGAAAAIEAHDAGARVAIVEKAPVAGGSSALSGGIVYAAGTSVQRSLGIQDTSEGMYKYWMAANQGLLDPQIMQLLADQSADVIDWLIKLGVQIPSNLLYYSGLEEQYATVTTPVKRGHCADGKGRGLMKALTDAVASRKIEVLYRTPAQRLVTDGESRVIGVKARGAKGSINIKANRGVVLACGGFARNKDMVKSYFPLQINAVPVAAPGNTGDGMLMASKVGSPIVDTGTLELPVSICALEIVQGQRAIMFSSAYFTYKWPAIFVNQTGKRFCNETAFYQITSPQILQQKEAYVIFDERVRKEGGGGIGFGFSPDLSAEIKNGWLKQAQTPAELATGLGLEPAAVEQTLRRFNENMKQGSDPDFGRSKAMGTIEALPLYGGKLTATVLESFGGVRINPRAEVLDAFGEPISGLYAGGAVAATMRAYAGSGAFLNTCFVLGRTAGKNCAGAKAAK